jgi:hypothetical protein
MAATDEGSLSPLSQYTVKKVSGFAVPSRDDITKLSLAGNNLIIPTKGEFG